MTSKKIIFLILILLTILCSALYYFLYYKKDHTQKPSNTQVKSEHTQEEKKFPGLTGEQIPEEKAKLRPVAFIIENHPDSRPQSGLHEADIVYETLAEGGITRFLAIYQKNEPKQIGPIRSARSYFAEITNEWAAVFAHVGGSDEAIEKLKIGYWEKLTDANEYYNGDYFKRLKNKYAPHNIYTSITNIRELIKDKNWQNEVTSDIPNWKFSTTDQKGENHNNRICMDFSTPNYQTCYVYNEKSKNYAREISQTKHIDELTNTQITPTNILVQFVNVEDIPNDPKLRIKVNLSEKGEALLFSGGKAKIAKWEKNSQGITEFKDATGNSLVFSPGQTWIELIPRNLKSKVVWRNPTNGQ